MERTLAILATSLALAAAGCAQAPIAGTPPGLVASEMHAPGGTGPVAYPTSIYDPSLLNDPSLIEDQPHNRGDKGPAPMLDMAHARRG
jgi:hypothetical protein